MLKYFLPIIVLISLLLLTRLAHAASPQDVVINEFSSNSDPEWVELYNQTGSTVSLSGWKLKDTSQSAKDISSLGQIEPGAFAVFEVSSGWLNNSGGDTITLSDDGGSSIDTLAYGHSGDPVTTPASPKSAGRNPDGSSSWQIIESPTKGSTNNTSVASPSPSPTPTPTPTSSSQPAKKSPTPTPKTSPSPLLTISPSPLAKKQSGVLGLKESTASPSIESQSPAPSQAPTTNTSPSKTKTAAILTGSGIVLIAAAFAAFLWRRKTLQSRENKDQP